MSGSNQASGGHDVYNPELLKHIRSQGLPDPTKLFEMGTFKVNFLTEEELNQIPGIPEHIVEGIMSKREK